MEISALTRSIVKRNHAIIAEDGYINSTVPDWTNCTVNIIINHAMGANFSQTIITAQKSTRLTGKTVSSQIFFYILEGSCKTTIGNETRYLSKGQFVFMPIQKKYLFDEFAEGTQILTFHKEYEKLEGYDIPEVQFGDTANFPASAYLGDDALRLQVLLPDNLSFDMAVNIFTYESGGHLPLVETHIMEHGLLFFQGQGVYRVGQDWYPVKKGDSIWMAPYCQQWFTAMGKEPAVYIYYKNVNRFPTQI
ncbi:MAG: (S)-ureidoglycine aminohydrolase [Bacteroidetes bacterium]|nr:(S)-ureidoglycine aminohydrolase [Bacteroidota bacterium]